MKHVCTNCERVYGEGPQTNPKKMQRGFCSPCWDWLLAYERFHWEEILLVIRKRPGR